MIFCVTETEVQISLLNTGYFQACAQTMFVFQNFDPILEIMKNTATEKQCVSYVVEYILIDLLAILWFVDTTTIGLTNIPPL